MTAAQRQHWFLAADLAKQSTQVTNFVTSFFFHSLCSWLLPSELNRAQLLQELVTILLTKITLTPQMPGCKCWSNSKNKLCERVGLCCRWTALKRAGQGSSDAVATPWWSYVQPWLSCCFCPTLQCETKQHLPLALEKRNIRMSIKCPKHAALKVQNRLGTDTGKAAIFISINTCLCCQQSRGRLWQLSLRDYIHTWSSCLVVLITAAVPHLIKDWESQLLEVQCNRAGP